MFFSKTFGYALRGILYIAARQDQQRTVQADDISAQLRVPRHFLAKILKTLSVQGFLVSSKGQRGGFMLAPGVLERPLMDLLVATDGLALFHTCVLRLRSCDGNNPCPLHAHFSKVQAHIREVLTGNSIGAFLLEDKTNLLRSLVVESATDAS
ncbi:MAG: Rrf2 family transcriptional regulator [Chitinophagaceae bacterium]|nr:MAG: Rrf2 family transcriptional regulator [Chitinophagaceae bacterium]